MKCPKAANQACAQLVAKGKAQRKAGYGSLLVVMDAHKVKASGWAYGSVGSEDMLHALDGALGKGRQ